MALPVLDPPTSQPGQRVEPQSLQRVRLEALPEKPGILATRQNRFQALRNYFACAMPVGGVDIKLLSEYREQSLRLVHVGDLYPPDAVGLRRHAHGYRPRAEQ